jgi:hypothetical protein
MKIVVTIRHGLVEEIISDEPTDVEVYIRDYDTAPGFNDEDPYLHSFVTVPKCDPDHEVFKEMEEEV